MQTWKVIVAMLLLVMIGFIGGFFAHRFMTQQHFRKVALIGTPPGFKEHLYRMLDADSAQIASIEPILSEYSELIHHKTREYRADRKELVDQMQAEMQPLLRADQQAEFEKFIHHFRHLPKKFKKNGRQGKKRE